MWDIFIYTYIERDLHNCATERSVLTNQVGMFTHGLVQSDAGEYCAIDAVFSGSVE